MLPFPWQIGVLGVVLDLAAGSCAEGTGTCLTESPEWPVSRPDPGLAP